jgi:hypothetical protein
MYVLPRFLDPILTIELLKCCSVRNKHHMAVRKHEKSSNQHFTWEKLCRDKALNTDNIISTTLNFQIILKVLS